MELLNQIDIASPDHVCVITNDQRVIVSIVKNGINVRLTFPITSPTPPAQQPAPQTDPLGYYQDRE